MQGSLTVNDYPLFFHVYERPSPRNGEGFLFYYRVVAEGMWFNGRMIEAGVEKEIRTFLAKWQETEN